MSQQLFYVKYVSIPKKFENKISCIILRIFTKVENNRTDKFNPGKSVNKPYGYQLNGQCHEIFKLGFCYETAPHMPRTDEFTNLMQCH